MSGPRWPWLVAIAVFTVVVAATFLRQDGTPKWQTVWAEDGRVFAACAWQQTLPSCLLTPYQGYLHTMPRIGAFLATLLDPAQLPVALAAFAALVSAGCAVLVARAVGTVTRSWIPPLLAGCSLALAWQGGREVLGNLTNLHWVLFAAASILLLCSWLGRRLDVFDLLAVALTCVTSALAPALVVLALGGVLARTERARITMGVAVLAVIPQAITIVTATRPTPLPPVPLTSMLAHFAKDMLVDGWFGPGFELLGVVALGIWAAVIIGVLGISFTRLRRDRGFAGAGLAGAGMAGPMGAAVTLATAALGVAGWWAASLVNHSPNPRYAYLPVPFAITSIVVGLGVLTSAMPARGSVAPEERAPVARTVAAARWAPLFVLVVFGVGFAASFRQDARASSGPDVTNELVAARSACAAGATSAVVLISPRATAITPDWDMIVPCSRVAAAPAVTPSAAPSSAP